MKFRKKVSNIIKNEFDSTPAYNEKYLKTKIKSHKSAQIFTITKEGSQCICLSVILID